MLNLLHQRVNERGTQVSERSKVITASTVWFIEKDSPSYRVVTWYVHQCGHRRQRDCISLTKSFLRTPSPPSGGEGGPAFSGWNSLICLQLTEEETSTHIPVWTVEQRLKTASIRAAAHIITSCRAVPSFIFISNFLVFIIQLHFFQRAELFHMMTIKNNFIHPNVSQTVDQSKEGGQTATCSCNTAILWPLWNKSVWREQIKATFI